MTMRIGDENVCIYSGSSMRRVFENGDLLKLETIPFSDFRRGDIVAFFPGGTGSAGIVHRVVSRTEKELTTMGDNNPGADKHKVGEGDRPRLVVQRSTLDGTMRSVPRGRAGMLEFRINRARRLARLAIAIPLRAIRKRLRKQSRKPGKV